MCTGDSSSRRGSVQPPDPIHPPCRITEIEEIGKQDTDGNSIYTKKRRSQDQDEANIGEKAEKAGAGASAAKEEIVPSSVGHHHADEQGEGDHGHVCQAGAEQALEDEPAGDVVEQADEDPEAEWRRETGEFDDGQRWRALAVRDYESRALPLSYGWRSPNLAARCSIRYSAASERCRI